MRKISGLAAFFLVIGSAVAAPVLSPVPNLAQEPQHATASKRITNYFTREHYLGLRIDDELSSKVFDRYLKSLDFFPQCFVEIRRRQLRAIPQRVR